MPSPAPPRERLRVLHIGTERQWRGGENQIRLLIEGSRHDIDHHVAYPRSSEGFARFAQMVPTYPLRRGGPGSLRDLIGVYRYCRREGIQLIDAHSGNAHWFAFELRLARLPVPVVVHRRVDNAIKRTWNTRWKYLSPQIAHFVAISERIERLLLDYGVPRHRVSLVRSAVSGETYRNIDRVAARDALRQRFDLPADTFLLANASALTRQKGNHVLLDALAHVARAEVNFHAFLAGDGPLRGALEAQCARLGLADRVTFLGHIDTVPQLLAGVDVLVMPSNYEGLGTLLLEGAFAGCTLVATEAGGMPEIVRHGETGLLSPIGDAEPLAANLLRLARDPALSDTLRRGARQHAESNFSVDAMVAGNLDVYRRVLRGQV